MVASFRIGMLAIQEVREEQNILTHTIHLLQRSFLTRA